MSIRLYFITVLLCLTTVSSYSQLWIDDFDGSNSNAFDIDLECGPDDEDWFGIGCCGTGCGPIVVFQDLCDEYVGLDGSFLGGYNTDDGGAGCDGNEDDEYIEWYDIDISSCVKPDFLHLCFDAARSENFDPDHDSQGWDNPSEVTFSIIIDGAPSIILAGIKFQGSQDTDPSFDTDCNNSGDTFLLTNEMTEYCLQIPGWGTSADLRIDIVGLNEPNEDIIIDNVAIYCEPDDSSFDNHLGCGSPCVDDADCDGVPDSEDCDPNDNCNTNSNVNDMDCDGVITAEDCDDDDPTNTNLNINDMDCDGVITSEDCDDDDPLNMNTNINDADCD